MRESFECTNVWRKYIKEDEVQQEDKKEGQTTGILLEEPQSKATGKQTHRQKDRHKDTVAP